MSIFGIAKKGFGLLGKKRPDRLLIPGIKRRSAFKKSNKKAKKVLPMVGAAGAGMVAGAEVTKPKNKKNSKYLKKN